MNRVSSLNHPGNPFVNLVLDQILEVSQIDPSSVNPTDKLGRDLGFSSSQIQTVVWNCAQKLRLPISFESCQVDDLPVSELVEMLKSWSTQGSRMSA